MSNEQDRLTSEPPSVKAINAGAAAVAMIIGSLTELAMVVGAFYVFTLGKVDLAGLCLLIGIPAVGPAIGKARGKVSGTTSLLLMSAFAHGAQKLPWHLLLPIALSVSALGCASMDTAKLREEANGYRRDLNSISDDIRSAHLGATIVCASYAKHIEALGDLCPKLGPTMLALDSAWRVARTAVDAYDSGLGTLQGVEYTVAELRRAAKTFRALTQEVHNAAMAEDSTGRSDPLGDRQGGAEAQPVPEGGHSPPANEAGARGASADSAGPR